MRHAVSIPLPQGTPGKILSKYWHVAASVLTLAMSIGVVRGKYSSQGGRVDAIESTRPEATAALTQRNANDLTEVRRRIDKMSDDLGDLKVSVARLCTAFGLQPVRERLPEGGVVSRPDP
jgi:hypothetical protein